MSSDTAGKRFAIVVFRDGIGLPLTTHEQGAIIEGLRARRDVLLDGPQPAPGTDEHRDHRHKLAAIRRVLAFLCDGVIEPVPRSIEEFRRRVLDEFAGLPRRHHRPHHESHPREPARSTSTSTTPDFWNEEIERRASLPDDDHNPGASSADTK